MGSRTEYPSYYNDARDSIDPSNNNEPLNFYTYKAKFCNASAISKDEIQGDIVGSTQDQQGFDDRRDESVRFTSREKDWHYRNKETTELPKNRDNESGVPVSSSYSLFGTSGTPSVSTPRSVSVLPQRAHPGMLSAAVDQWQINPSTNLNPLTYMSMSGEPNFFGMMGLGGFGQFGLMQTPEASMMMAPFVKPTKEVIHLKSCILYPPKPTAPPPTTRDRPPGCRTVFVGGLPETISEEVVREIFQRCGKVSTVRMSKKNFCHVRFESEVYVDSAIFLSGYRVKLGDKDDSANTGRIHVDYAQARDDQYEWECQQRAIHREMRHRERLEQERLRPPSPPPVVHYNDIEAPSLIEKLKREDSFQKAVLILITWLERGECNKRNAGHFYSMIQSTSSHVKRLINERQQYEDELQKAKQLLRQRMQGIFLQFNQIEKVFAASSHQKVWDHFTKAQRKSIDSWRKQTQEIKNAQLEEILNEREEDEMDLSDDDAEPSLSKMPRLNEEEISEKCWNSERSSEEYKLREENDSLRCQLEAYKNEVDVLKSENHHEIETKDRQLHALQQALQNLQYQLLNNVPKEALKPDQLTKSGFEGENCQENAPEIKQKEKTDVSNAASPVSSSSTVSISEKEAKLIGVISTFLHVHPFGASVDYIWSYLHQIDNTLQPRDVETLMLKFPAVFKQGLSGVGATLERRWTFCGFSPT